MLLQPLRAQPARRGNPDVEFSMVMELMVPSFQRKMLYPDQNIPYFIAIFEI
jgi:hypothetical protein